MKTKLIALVALTISTCSVTAQTITTMGGPTCGEWIQETRSNGDGRASTSSRFWVLGYLSGTVSATGVDAIKTVDAASLFAWMNNYCQANPLNSVPKASKELFLELAKRQQR